MSKPTPAEVLQAAQALAPRIVAWRRDIHQHPELSGQEERTARLVAEHLTSLGLEVRTGVGGHGVVGVIRGGRPAGGRVLGLRADMDALPIQEETGLPFASLTPGVMHACGHDAHTSILMGAAQLLAAWRHHLPGDVVVLFQPAEEAEGGAEPMIRDGALDNPRVTAVAGLHVGNDTPAGSVAFVRGAAQASSDTVTIRIIGSGGHAAHPHTTVDPVLMAAHVVVALQAVVARQTDPRQAAVVTVGAIHGGTRSNIIPPEVTLLCTVRTQDQAVREAMPKRIEGMVAGVTAAFGGSYALDYRFGYPPLVNDDAMVTLARESALRLLGAERVAEGRGSMGAEDFAYFAQAVPGVFFRLGTRDPEAQVTYPGHHPKFTVDERALPIGAAMFVQLAFDYLEG